MTRLEAGQLENRIVTRTGDLDDVVRLLSKATWLWHNWTKAIYTELGINHRDIMLKTGEYIKLREGDDLLARSIKNKKVSGLKQLSIMFDILAETFRDIEDSIDEGVVNGKK
jgi:hypothetical protein